MKKALWISLICLLLGIFSLEVHAQPGNSEGTVEGVIILAPKQNIVQGGGRYGRPGAAVSKSQSSADSALVWVEGGAGAQTSRQVKTDRAVLDQRDLAFRPSLLAVPQNGTVRILNSDPVYHNVFSLSPVKKFDVGRRPKGKYLDVTFNKPGAVEVFCDIHSNMRATIYVLPDETRSWTKIKSGDEFQFGGLEPGRYTLHIYSSGYQPQAIEFEIEDGETVNLGTVTLNL